MNILIVESKAKVKPIQKYLGTEEWRVLATGGHIRDLPSDRAAGHPQKEVKKADWSPRRGELPDPPWVWTKNGEATVGAIKTEAARHDRVAFYLASDPDREGERIAWHLARELSGLGECHRVTFQEITKTAVHKAIEAPGKVDQKLVDATLVRIFLDRLVGWRSGKIARRFVNGARASMGRVQTPTLGFLVERELERRAHVPVKYLEVHAETGVTSWRVIFHAKEDADAWRDAAGEFKGFRTSDRQLAELARDAISRAGVLEIAEVKARNSRKSAPPPFTTDKLLHAAGSRWGWSPGRSSKVASGLYEAGLITYIRTDSTRLSDDAVKVAQAVIGQTWTPALVAPQAGHKVADTAQDAHEAIRPTDPSCVKPDGPDEDGIRLYSLIRAQTLASLMVPALRETRSLEARVEGLDRRIEGSVGWYSQPGWRQAFVVPGLDGPLETTPIVVAVGTVDPLLAPKPEGANPDLREGETQPPARYRAHTLISAMKESGIGRPSTYAKMVDKLRDRGFVEEEEGGLKPTSDGENIWLEAAPTYTAADGSGIFDTAYTAAMEAELDAVSEGRASGPAVWVRVRDAFKAAHEAARAASDSGALLPRVRSQLDDFILAHPALADEVGALDQLTQKAGRELLQGFRARGLQPPATVKQTAAIDRLLEHLDLDLATAAEEAGLALAGGDPNRQQASTLYEHLSALRAENDGASKRQIGFIEGLAGKLELEEAAAAGLVDCASYSELTGGRDGTASALITALKKRLPRRGS